jgi:hypothetical protein
VIATDIQEDKLKLWVEKDKESGLSIDKAGLPGQ